LKGANRVARAERVFYGRKCSHLTTADAHRASEVGVIESLALVDEQLSCFRVVPVVESFAWFKYRGLRLLADDLAGALVRDVQ
jgi:hypothetical protein